MNQNPIEVKAVFQKRTPLYPIPDLDKDRVRNIRRFHTSVDQYTPTPLCSLPALSKTIGIKKLYVKDESFRFGLNAFKALGATWALARILAEELNIDPEHLDFSYLTQKEIRQKLSHMTFATCTDGNHGRGVAWAAGKLGAKARIFMPKGSAQERVKNIENLGARVVVTDTNYDNTVRLAAQLAAEQGWHLVQDTSWHGYETIPLWILQGYATMADEVLQEIQKKEMPLPTHLFLQAGVGSMAASILGVFANALGEHCPATYILEPDKADCFYQSALAGDGCPKAVTGDLDTMMAGLACGEPNPYAWSVLRNLSTGFISCTDEIAALGMRALARPEPGDPHIISGESGAVGPGLAKALMTRPDLSKIREEMGLDKESVLLCFSTEGDTDPLNYKKILSKS